MASGSSPTWLDAPLLRYRQWRLERAPCAGHVHLEVGFGNGEFIAGLARRAPEDIFYGIEYNPKYFHKGLKRIGAMRLSNVRLICTEAESCLFHLVPDGFFDAIHINFPDPWPKLRHRVRRLIDSVFVSEAHRILTPSGVVALASDFREYFDGMVDFFQRGGFDVRVVSDAPPLSRPCKTKYEKAFIEAGTPVYYALLNKAGNDIAHASGLPGNVIKGLR